MKKRNLLFLLMTACLATAFAACDKKSDKEAASTLGDYVEYIGSEKVVYSQVERLDGQILAADGKHNLLAIQTEEEDPTEEGGMERKIKVYDMNTGAELVDSGYKYSVTTPEDELLVQSVEINYPIISLISENNMGDEPTYMTSLYLAKPFTPLTVEEERVNVTVQQHCGLYEVTAGETVYWVDENMTLLRTFSTDVTHGYTLNSEPFFASNEGYLYTYTFDQVTRMIQVYNKEGVCSMQYTFPSNVAMIGNPMGGSDDSVFVLSDGNILVQEWTLAEAGSNDFNVQFYGMRAKVTSKVIDYQTGEVKELDLNYIVDYMSDLNESGEWALKNKEYNSALVYSFSQLGIAAQAKEAIIANDGRIVYAEEPSANVGFIKMLGNDYILAYESNGYYGDTFTYCLMDKDYNVKFYLPANVLEMDEGEVCITDENYATRDGIYDFNKKCVYSFESMGYLDDMFYIDDVWVAGNAIYVKTESQIDEEEYYYYRYDNASRQLVEVGSWKTCEPLDITDNYALFQDVKTGAVTLYNNQGTALLKVQAASEVENSEIGHSIYEGNGVLWFQSWIEGNPVIYVVRK